MSIDHNGMAVLPEDECLRRLRFRGMGRIALSVGALPAIFPINFTVDGRDIYFRTAPGTKLDAAARNAVVAFEVDDVDPISHTGWSVLVVGPAEEVRDPGELERLRRLPLTRWVRGGEDSLIRIRAELVSGRELEGAVR